MRTIYLVFLLGWIGIIPISLSSQVIFQRASITKKDGTQLDGYIKIKNPSSYHDQIEFKAQFKDKETQIFTAEELQKFNFRDKGAYESYYIPLMRPGHILDGSKAHKLLRLLNEGDYKFYLYRVDKQEQYYYYQDREGKIHPLYRTPESAESFRSTNGEKYMLPTGTPINNPKPGLINNRKNQVLYFYDGDSLFVLQNTFQRQLNQILRAESCLNDDQMVDRKFKLRTNKLRYFSKSLHKCMGSDNYTLSEKSKQWQIQVVGLAMVYNVKNLEDYFGYAFSAEYRQNLFSASVGLVLRQSLYNGTSKGFGNYLEGDKIDGRQSMLGISTHFLPGRNIRPYFQGGVTFDQIERERPEFRGTRSLTDGDLEVDFQMNIGVDYYFGRFHMLRVELTQPFDLIFSVGYGVYAVF